MNVLLFTSCADDSKRIADHCDQIFDSCMTYRGRRGDRLPNDLWLRDIDVIISYCSRWILPQSVLQSAPTAINFHPAPPEYPGIGGLNWALFNGDREFGVTCHHMAAKVDSGPIIEVRRFPILESFDVEALYYRSHLKLESLATDVLTSLANGEALPKSDCKWSNHSYTRKELDDLACVTPDMSEDEVQRHIRATHFRDWKPYTRVGKHTFELKS